MFTNIEVKPNGVKWGYYKKDMQWVVLDSNNNIVKEIVNDDGTKSIYFELYGYQPSTFKEHLDKDGKADPIAQLKYCKKVKCSGCYCCVWSENMILTPLPPSTMHKKEKILKTDGKISDYDNLCQNVVNTNNYPDCDHPLLEDILKYFKGKK